jgi:hypothetical protein
MISYTHKTRLCALSPPISLAFGRLLRYSQTPLHNNYDKFLLSSCADGLYVRCLMLWLRCRIEVLRVGGSLSNMARWLARTDSSVVALAVDKNDRVRFRN